MSRVLKLVPISAGMALTSSCFLILGELIYSTVSILSVISSIIIGGLICLYISDAASQLTKKYPASSGLRAWTYKSFGDPVSLTVTYILLSVVCLFAGVETLIIAEVIHYFNSNIPSPIISLIIVVSITVLNLYSLQLARKFQIALVYFLICLIFAISIYIMFQGNTGGDIRASFTFDLNILPVLVGTAIFLFIGFEWVATQGESKQDYDYAIGRAMKLSLLILIAMYVVFAFSTVFVDYTYLAKKTSVMHIDLGAYILGDAGRIIMLLFSIIALVTTFNAGILGSSRLVYALSRENKLPRYLIVTSEKGGVPYMSILTVAVIAYALALVEFYLDLTLPALIVCSTLYCVIYASVVLSRAKLNYELQGSSRLTKVLFTDYLVGGLLFIIAISSVFSIQEQVNNIAAILLTVIVIVASLNLSYSTKKVTVYEKG